MTAPRRVRSRHLPDWAARLRDEDGSTLLLTIFYGFLALVLILLVVAATSLYLERKRLLSLADGAALVGAEAFALDAVALTPQGPRPGLHSADVADAVDEYLRAVPANNLEEVTVLRAESADGESATVELSAEWRPPLVSLLVPDGIRIEATSMARSVFD
jgi:Putative Flp pilus-assembly TadE/G-like